MLKKPRVCRKLKIRRGKHKIIQIAVICGFILSLFVFSLPEKQVRSFARNYTFNLVMKNQEELLRMIDKYSQKDKRTAICRYWFVEDTIHYKKLGDKDLSRAFRQFHLRYMICTDNGNAIFHFEPYLRILIQNYSNGFYYSEKDQPMGRSIMAGGTGRYLTGWFRCFVGCRPGTEGVWGMKGCRGGLWWSRCLI